MGGSVSVWSGWIGEGVEWVDWRGCGVGGLARYDT